MQVIKGMVLSADGVLPLAPVYPTEAVNILKAKLATSQSNLAYLKAIQGRYGTDWVLESGTLWPGISIGSAIIIVTKEIDNLKLQILDYGNKYSDAVTAYNQPTTIGTQTNTVVPVTPQAVSDTLKKKGTTFIIIGFIILVLIIAFIYFKFIKK